ncbi:NUDIX hydrolase [Rufibacter sediminis]|uniref:GDP-mannose pyrophosphatase n=1 Tax=Rufibacter sediminis TaxID=2762756 RepID=A0ABR6VS18_9BACT|nr:NUDIX hydrolase [Rufibacter sediminis]MBC3539986.1 NUDIX hydrolase [Rufibacter sediminis]
MSTPRPWRLLRSQIAFKHKWYTLRRDEVELPNGHVVDDFFVSERPDGAYVFPVTQENEVLFVRQYKHAAQKIFLELPAGSFFPNEEKAEDAATRELLEETGAVLTQDLVPLAVLHDNPAKDTNRIHLFLAQNVRVEQSQVLDVTEDIEVVRVPLDQVLAKVLNGEICVSGSVALCFLALKHLQRL